MPALVTCRGTLVETQWNVGSDDFVLPAFITMALSLFSSILVMAALAALYVSPECPDDRGVPPILYYPFFMLQMVEVATAIIETIIMSISCRGRIWNTARRDKQMPKYLYIRLILLLLEFVAVILCTVASFDPSIIGMLDCNSYSVAVALLGTASVVVLLKFVGSVTQIFLFLDPCGLFTPGLLQHLSFLDSADDCGEMPLPLSKSQNFPWFFGWLKNPTLTHADIALTSPCSATSSLPRDGPNVVRFWQRQSSIPHTIAHTVRGGYTLDEISEQASHFRRNHIGLRRLQRRLRVMLCCLGVGGHRSRGVALEDIARALYTLFDFGEEDDRGSGESGEGVRLVLSDVIAGFKLVNMYQREKMEKLGDRERLEDKFRMVTFNRMPANQKPHYIYKPPRPFVNDKSEYHLLVDDLIHYMRYSMGVYGWPLHLFSNPASGLCQLASRTCCKADCVLPSDDSSEGEGERRGCCECGVAAMTLQTGVERDDVLYMSMDNEIYKAPFAVVLERRMRSVVVSIRGTLSIKDALTDMSYSMQFVEIDGVHETYVHKGMYAAADEVRQRLMGRTRQEVRLEAIRTLGQVSEVELDTMMENETRILPKIFQQYKEYQLIVSGHSLGAGVASVLALLLRKHFPDLHCYAFSPPGCVFSYPLANYSRKFTTSVVLGNDLVPRLSFRSLLYLKQSVKHLLQVCKRPKCEVLFRPRWCGRSVRGSHTSSTLEKSTTSLPEGFEEQILGENTTLESLQNAVFPLTHVALPMTSIDRQETMDLLDNPQVFEREITDHLKNPCGRFMPTFPPGKIFHLKITNSAAPCCLGYCYPNKLEMERVRNEDLCMIIIDRGAVEDHLPNHVLVSLERFKRQTLAQHYNGAEVERLRDQTRRERQQRREARELSSVKGGWVFPTSAGTVGRSGYTHYSTQTSSASSSSSSYSVTSTPNNSGTLTGVEDVTTTGYNGRFPNRLSAIPEDNSFASDYEMDGSTTAHTHALDTVELEVEIHPGEESPRLHHIEARQFFSERADGYRRETEQNDTVPNEESDENSVISIDEDNSVKGSRVDAKESSDEEITTDTREECASIRTPPVLTPLKLGSELRELPLLARPVLLPVAASKAPPSAIPVRVPHSQTQSQSLRGSNSAAFVGPLPSPHRRHPSRPLPSPHRRHPSTSQEESLRLGRRISRPFSRRRSSATGRVLTVQCRRGPKLRLIMPTSYTQEEAVSTQL